MIRFRDNLIIENNNLLKLILFQNVFRILMQQIQLISSAH